MLRLLRNNRAKIALTSLALAIPTWSVATKSSDSDDYVPDSKHMRPIRCEDGTSVIPWAAPTRAEQLSRLKTEEFDVVVIGGGCVGAGVAWEASTRGLKVALVEADDFAAGTSGRSTKLIHGGVRYLEAAVKNLDLGMYHLVKEALEERAHLLHAAPYMAHPLPTLIPIYHWWELPYMYIGVKLYDLLAGSRRAVPAAYHISREEALYQFPMLREEGLVGGIVYYDGQHNDTRMNLMIAMTASQSGAAVANYTSVRSILKDIHGRAAGVTVRDEQTGEMFPIRAKTVVNATGCFGDSIRKMDNPRCQPLILGAAGVHIVLPDHFSPDKMGLIVPKTKDGRVLFFLPWEGSTICGTTDAPCEISMTPIATSQEIDFILEESNRFLNRKVSKDDVKAAWSGIRPLLLDPSLLPKKKDNSTEPSTLDLSSITSSQLSRSHVVEVSDSQMVSILGGKWTTYRRMAQDTVDTLAKLPNTGLPPISPSRTMSMQLLGADRNKIVFNQKYDRIPVTLREKYQFPRDVARHLTMNYGTRALQVARLTRDDRSLTHRLHPSYPIIEAEVRFAVEQEYALTPVDVLARRTRLAFLNEEAARAALPRVARIMASLLKWDSKREKEEIARTEKFLNTMKKTGIYVPPVAVHNERSPGLLEPPQSIPEEVFQQSGDEE